jgi:hypothetical protein
MPSIEEQYAECRQWRDWLIEAGYKVYFNYTDAAVPFDREWQVYATDRHGAEQRIATVDIDGCGASWHGPDAVWTEAIGKHAK